MSTKPLNYSLIFLLLLQAPLIAWAGGRCDIEVAEVTATIATEESKELQTLGPAFRLNGDVLAAPRIKLVSVPSAETADWKQCFEYAVIAAKDILGDQEIDFVDRNFRAPIFIWSFTSDSIFSYFQDAQGAVGPDTELDCPQTGDPSTLYNFYIEDRMAQNQAIDRMGLVRQDLVELSMHEYLKKGENRSLYCRGQSQK